VADIDPILREHFPCTIRHERTRLFHEGVVMLNLTYNDAWKA
jgi:hypothetical protein